jgi:hypothetical protein
MKIAQILSVALLAAAGGASPALAQASGQGIMIRPGVYTTPEISAKCMDYARRTEPREGADNRRQSLALACAKKLYADQNKKKKKKKKAT